MHIWDTKFCDATQGRKSKGVGGSKAAHFCTPLHDLHAVIPQTVIPVIPLFNVFLFRIEACHQRNGY